jgi:hypothetical protein
MSNFVIQTGIIVDFASAPNGGLTSLIIIYYNVVFEEFTFRCKTLKKYSQVFHQR